jgi:hypothetical protein
MNDKYLKLSNNLITLFLMVVSLIAIISIIHLDYFDDYDFNPIKNHFEITIITVIVSLFAVVLHRLDSLERKLLKNTLLRNGKL